MYCTNILKYSFYSYELATIYKIVTVTLCNISLKTL